MKQCYSCKKIKELSMFNRHSYSKDGYKGNCRECSIQETRTWRLNNPGADKRYRIENLEKTKQSIRTYRSSKKGRAKHAEIEANRRARKYNATPSWLTKSQIVEIQEYYLLAAELSWLSDGGLSVDHIIPLKGEDVCGLHVPWNLQILPLIDNIKKSNKTF